MEDESRLWLRVNVLDGLLHRRQEGGEEVRPATHTQWRKSARQVDGNREQVGVGIGGLNHLSMTARLISKPADSPVLVKVQTSDLADTQRGRLGNLMLSESGEAIVSVDWFPHTALCVAKEEVFGRDTPDAQHDPPR